MTGEPNLVDTVELCMCDTIEVRVRPGAGSKVGDEVDAGRWSSVSMSRCELLFMIVEFDGLASRPVVLVVVESADSEGSAVGRETSESNTARRIFMLGWWS